MIGDYPVTWTSPDVKAVLGLLETIYRADDIERIVVDTGLPIAEVAFSARPALTWRSVFEVAAARLAVNKLLDVVAEHRPALRVRLDELRAPTALLSGVQPWSRRVTENELPAAIEEFVRNEAGGEGTSVVIGPPGVPGAVVAVLPSEAKGLEFDAVLIVEPERILPTGHAARPSSTSPSPAPPNASVSCTRTQCRRP